MTAKTEPAADPVKAADAAKAVLRIRKTLARMLSESEGERTAAANAFHRMAAANGWRPDEILILPPQPGGPNIMDLEPRDRDDPLHSYKKNIWLCGMHAMTSALGEANRQYRLLRASVRQDIVTFQTLWRAAVAERDRFQQRAVQAEAERDDLRSRLDAARTPAIQEHDSMTTIAILDSSTAAVLLTGASSPDLQARVVGHLDAAGILDMLRAGPPAGLGDMLIQAYLDHLEGGRQAGTASLIREVAPVMDRDQDNLEVEPALTEIRPEPPGSYDMAGATADAALAVKEPLGRGRPTGSGWSDSAGQRGTAADLFQREVGQPTRQGVRQTLPVCGPGLKVRIDGDTIWVLAEDAS
ncbi:hypothetical protein [Azospirillum argentinense]